ncbi:hypothetical protein BH160DRAFT_0712 [Burkholderia sp. H160]|nr:hypothetical protein BH160DRAFT_0712 [Burkholderia sp. H160]
MSAKLTIQQTSGSAFFANMPVISQTRREENERRSPERAN